MEIMFCDECGSLMQPSKGKKGEVILICPACGFKKAVEDPDNLENQLNVEREIEHTDKEKILIDDGSSKIGTLPTIDRFCKKCNTATPHEYWDVQTRSADEAPTRFYRCTVCETTDREYD